MNTLLGKDIYAPLAIAPSSRRDKAKWTPAEDAELIQMLEHRGNNLPRIAQYFARTDASIAYRVSYLLSVGATRNGLIGKNLYEELLMHIPYLDTSAISQSSRTPLPALCSLAGAIHNEHTLTRSNTMKYNHVASLLQTNYTTIQVTFTEGGRIHTYKVKTPHSLVAGEDSVVVKVGTEYRVAQVIAVHDEPQIDTESSTEYQWIVQKVDSKDYEAVLKKEELFIETLQSVEKAKKRAEVLEDFKKHMSISGEAVTLLDDAVKQLNE